MKPDWKPEETARAREMRRQGATYALVRHVFGRSAKGAKRHLQYRSEPRP